MSNFMKRIFPILVVSIVLSFMATTIFAQNATRVKFRKGTVSKIVSANLNGFKSTKVFVIRVRAGQTLKVEQIKSDSSTHYVTVAIKSPSGEDVTDSDASCNNRKEVTPTESGDYVITVSECMKADEWRGSFRLKFWVE